MRRKLIMGLAAVAACTMCAACASFVACSPESKDTDVVMPSCGGVDDETATPSEGLEFVLLADGNSYAMVGLGTCQDVNVVIPATYNGKPVTQVGRYATYTDLFAVYPEAETNYDLYGDALVRDCDMLFRTDVKSVYVPDGVTTIGLEAFAFSTALETVRLPDTLTYLGSSVFTSCTSLKEVTIPENIEYIYGYTFNACVSLEKVTLGSKVKYVGYRAFKSCTSLTEINLPNVIQIDDYAFSLCYQLQTITLGDKLKYIGEYAFENCHMSEIHLADTLLTIGNNAFECCAHLKSVTIPQNVTSVGSAVFNSCSALEKVVWNAQAAVMTDPENPEDTQGRTFSLVLNLKGIVVGEGVTELPNYLFYNCRNVTKISLPSTLTKIGDYTFYGCEELATITYAGTVAQWKALEKGEKWDSNLPAYTVVCSDGNLYSTDK